MRGKIDKLWENGAKTGKKYVVLEVDGQRFSLWDESWLGKLSEGDAVEFEWKQAGDYRNITEIEVEQPRAPYDPDMRDRQITRMSCLKSASTILESLDMEPDQKIDLTLETARKFEKYVKEP